MEEVGVLERADYMFKDASKKKGGRIVRMSEGLGCGKVKGSGQRVKRFLRHAQLYSFYIQSNL